MHTDPQRPIPIDDTEEELPDPDPDAPGAALVDPDVEQAEPNEPA